MSTTVPEEVIEKIRSENDIVEIVEEYVQLKKQGRNYFGLCPFHDEKSPSFSVTKDKQIFHCFGCGKGGNVISFLMEMETFTFMEAMSYLAKRAGIHLPDINKKESTLSEEATTILSAFGWLSKYYNHLLKYAEKGNVGLEYLTSRGIEESAVDDFQLGYAPTNSEYTIEFLKKKGFHTQVLVKAGILSTKDNQHFVDVFRGRVIYPIKNHLGRTVAFGGRAFQNEEPKYLNSPEHELFQKGKLLFNFNLAKNHIRKQKEVVLFEGYMDVIQAHQAGIKNGVATLGTALTNTQAKLLNRYVDNVIICFDDDNAGIKASFEAANTLKQSGCEVKIANVKENMDPDEYIKRHGGNAFIEKVLQMSDTYFSFYMRYQKRNYNLNTDSERIAYLEDITKELAKLESPIEREFYVKEIADEFNLSTEIIYYDIEQQQKRNNNFKDKYRKNSNTSTTRAYFNQSNKISPAYQNAEKHLLTYMLQHPYIIEKVQSKLGVAFNMDEHKIILTHLYALYEEYNDINISKLIDKLSDEYLKRIVTEMAMSPTNDDIPEQEINDYIHIIEQEKNDISYLRVLRQKQKQEQNPILAAKIGLEIIELEKQLKQS